MKKQSAYLAAFFLCLAGISFSQTTKASRHQNFAAHAVAGDNFVHAMMQRMPWDRGVFLDGGLGVANKSSDHFLSAGIRLGKVLTPSAGTSVFSGQFEYAVELIPYWQAFTPKRTYLLKLPNTSAERSVRTGGTYSGLSLTPIILRWNLVHWKRVMPWMQAAGGLVWTNHKFPPNGSRGTSVWNFEPQFGVGLHYFLKPTQSVTFAANAVHISSASLGDFNPGVTASVQFQLGYTWWK